MLNIFGTFELANARVVLQTQLYPVAENRFRR